MKYFLIISFLLITCAFEFLRKNISTSFEEQKIIYIIPLNNVKQSDVSLAHEELKSFYKYNVVILNRDVIPTQLRNPSGKYNANKILKFLGEKYEYLDGKLIGITNVNISTKRTLNNVVHNDWSILGFGGINGQSCVVSTKNMVTNHNDRLSKVTIHEVGHTLGLSHCDYDPKCLMNDAKGRASKVDSEEKMMCQNCRNAINLN